MTDTQARVDIPADVKDNVSFTVRITSVDARASEGGVPAERDLDSNRRHLETYGYVEHSWDDVDIDENPVTLTWFAKDGRAMWLYETSYYTRVACSRCEYRWAQRYVQQVGDGWKTNPVPLCGDHLDTARMVNRHDTEAGHAATLLESEPLRIGQH